MAAYCGADFVQQQKAGVGQLFGARKSGVTKEFDFISSTNFPAALSFLRASNGCYYNAAGLLSYAANDIPRYDYDPVTHILNGLLIERASTNLVLQSPGGPASWSNVNCAATANATTGPDGTLNGTLLTITNGANGYGQAITVVPLTVYTLSFWALRGSTTNMTYSVFDNIGSVDIISPTSYYAQTNGATWSRVSVSFTAPAGCTTASIYMNRDSGATGTAFLFGCQLEALAFPTSYIPTTIAQAARAVDLVFTNAIPFYNPLTGTVYNEWKAMHTPPVTVLEGVTSFSDASPNNIIALAANGFGGQRGSGQILFGGVAQFNPTQAPAIVANTIYKQAIAYSVSLNLYTQQGNVATSTAGAISLPAPTRLSMGSTSGGTAGAGALWYRKFRYFNSFSSAQTLQAMTT